MRAVKSLFYIMCLTILVTVGAQPTFADTIQQCIAEVCKGASSAVSIGSFLSLEKKTHPGLEEFYRRYQVQLDQVRIAREKRVRESLVILGQTQKLTDSIRKMSDQELMSLFVERRPWNVGTDRARGQYVVAEPLTGDVQQGEIIKQIFSRLQLVSPLYAAQLKMDQLNVKPRAALQLSETQKN